jgi:CheY-like chemotaxis protein
MERKSVLIVDDDPVQRQLMSGIVPRFIDADVLTASCGRKALDIFTHQQLNVALVLLDVHMPDCDGVEVIVELANRACPAGIVIVSASGATLPSIDTLARASGLNVLAASSKPISLELMDTMATWVDQYGTDRRAQHDWPTMREHAPEFTMIS